MFTIIMVIIFGAIALLAIVGAVRFAKKAKEDDEYRGPTIGARIIAGVALILTALFIFWGTFYTNGVGQAKVTVNYDGTVAGAITTPGAGFKSPLQSFNDWDLFSQNLSYIGGGNNGGTDYSGGTANGPQITTSVANGAQANIDLSVVYSIDADHVQALYEQYRSQELFTKQIIEAAVRSTTRTVPSQYTAVDFRGVSRGEAQQKMQDALQSQLSPYGVKIEVVNLQEVRYSDDVENSLKAVEVANQGKQKAEADLAAAQVAAQQKVVEAQAQADANAVLNNSLTPQLLQQKYIDAINNSKTTFVVPEGSSPLINVPAAPAAQ